jgi:hypothetical protein
MFAPGGGIAAADAICASDASAAGLSGNFLALVSVTGQSVTSRFAATPMGTQWVRPDGVMVAKAPFTELEAPINVDLAGMYYSVPVWTGESGTPNTPSSCYDWMADATQAPYIRGVAGVSSDAGTACRNPANCSRAFYDNVVSLPPTCNTALKLYCMEL